MPTAPTASVLSETRIGLFDFSSATRTGLPGVVNDRTHRACGVGELETAKGSSDPGIDEPIAMASAGSLSYFAVDGLGSVVATNDAAGTVTHSVVFDAWGNVKAENGTRTHPFTYTGREVGEAGLHFYRARYYQPGVGRFSQEDPLGLEWSNPSLYAYVGSSPASWFDPTGLVRYNAPAPRTVPVAGPTAQALQCLENCLRQRLGNQNLDLLVTGGAETTGHTAGSHHSRGEAVDIAGPRANPGCTWPNVSTCAASCGFGAGQFEDFPGDPNRDHSHLQLNPGNGSPALPTPNAAPNPAPTPAPTATPTPTAAPAATPTPAPAPPTPQAQTP